MSKNDIPALLFYTDDILDNNFHRIIDFNNDVLETLDSLVSLAETQGSRLSALENINLVVKTKSGKLLPFLAGAAVGVYIYRNRQKLKKLIDDNRQKMPDTILHTDEVIRPKTNEN